jgi:hypothetical protein
MGLLEELAVRCEIVLGPDRVLDGEICLALGLAKGNVRVDERTGWVVGGNTPLPVKPLEYTSSVDAAMTIAPSGLRVLIDSDGCHCRITDPHGDDDKLPWNGVAALAHSMARATSAAALRARHALALSKGSEG